MTYDILNNKFPDTPFFTCASPNPTLSSKREGSLNYEWSEKRWYGWDGTAWHKLTYADDVVLAAGTSGAVFPSSPTNGQVFYSTFLKVLFYFNASAGRWYGADIYEVDGGKLATVVASGYLNKEGIPYSATAGFTFSFDAACTEMSLNGVFVGAGGLSVRANGVDVPGAALTGLTVAGAAENLASDVIPAGQVIGLYATVGTSLLNPQGKARFRRVQLP